MIDLSKEVMLDKQMLKRLKYFETMLEVGVFHHLYTEDLLEGYRLALKLISFKQNEYVDM